VRLLRIEGGTHEIPSTQRPKGLKFGWTGKSRDIETADQIWQFFSEVAK
jgi:poly(3-hydroxybutyrate) depolymerase